MGLFRSFVILLLLSQILLIQTMAARPMMGSNSNPFLLLSRLSTIRTTGSEESAAESPSSSELAEGGEESYIAEPPSGVRMEKHHSDKSVAGGGVIIGGLVTAIFAAVYCYIRVTRKRVGENH